MGLIGALVEKVNEIIDNCKNKKSGLSRRDATLALDRFDLPNGWESAQKILMMSSRLRSANGLVLG